MSNNQKKQDAAPAEQTQAATETPVAQVPAPAETPVIDAPVIEVPAASLPAPVIETPVTETLPEGCFIADGKQYRVRLSKVNIPGLGERTALEIAVDEEAQQWLIKNNCVGSVIEEVI